MLKDSQTTRLKPKPTGTGWLLAPVLVVLAWAAVLLVGGCTSDPANVVGSGLIDNQIDTTLALVELNALDNFAGLKTTDAGQGIPASETLYLGTEKNTRASFIVNFDFGSIFSDEFPAPLFVADSIKTVKLNLTKLLPYESTRDSIYVNPDTGDTTTIQLSTGNPLELLYFVRQLNEPFDPADFDDYPLAVPPFDATIINQDFAVPVTSSEPSLKLYVSDFLDWVAAGTKVGFLVQLSELSDPGLVGFASGELSTFSEVPPLAVGTIVGPDLVVDFLPRDVNLQVPPAEDTSVFEEIDPAPETAAAAADSFVLRTGLRSYPAFRFDLSTLPKNAVINRAVLSVTNDTSSSYGPEFSVMVSEIRADVMDDPSHALEVAAVLDSAQVYPLSYRSNLRPGDDYVIEFDITTGIRRAINRVNEEPRGFLLSGVEDKFVFPFGDLPPDLTEPGFYFRQLNLLGFADPVAEHRPRLKVWYSVVDELSGGGR